MTVEEVITVVVPVADQGRALAFYTGTLGLKLARLHENPPGIRHVEVTGNGITRLSLVTWIESMPPGSLRGLVLRSGNLHADYERLVSVGIDFDSPPCAGPDGTCQAVFRDPDGNAIVLQGAEAPRWPRLQPPASLHWPARL